MYNDKNSKTRFKNKYIDTIEKVYTLVNILAQTAKQQHGAVHSSASHTQTSDRMEMGGDYLLRSNSVLTFHGSIEASSEHRQGMDQMQRRTGHRERPPLRNKQ